MPETFTEDVGRSFALAPDLETAQGFPASGVHPRLHGCVPDEQGVRAVGRSEERRLMVRNTLIALVAGFLAWLPLSSQGEHGAELLNAQIASFQQKLDAAYSEALMEDQRAEERWAKRVAELRRRGITVQGGSTTTRAERLRAKVEEKTKPEQVALKEYVEDFFGMCLEEIIIGLDPLPHFSIKLRSKQPTETCG